MHFGKSVEFVFSAYGSHLVSKLNMYINVPLEELLFSTSIMISGSGDFWEIQVKVKHEEMSRN